MKFNSLHNWEYAQPLEGLLFFVQRIDEMLFDYTLDSYKPPALNAPFLCIEALRTIEDIENDLIDKTNLKHILEELQWAIRQDSAASEIIELDQSYYLGDINDITSRNHKVKLEVLLSEIKPSLYLRKTEKIIYTATQNVKEKNLINNLAKTYLTTLKNIGFHNNHIYSKLNDYFYRGKVKNITSVDDLLEFFELFDIEPKKYEVIFVASKMFQEIKESCESFKIDILISEDEGCQDFPEKFCRSRQGDELFLKVKDVKALDPHSARENAERRIELLGNLFVLFHHKEKTQWKPKALVLQSSPQSAVILKPPISPMKRGFDLRPQQAANQLKKVVTAFSLESDSFTKFDRVIDLHRIAVENDVLENQLLNLWTSFETLIPSHPKKSKIQNIVDSLLPFLKVNYVFTLVERVTKDLVNWDRRSLWPIVNKFPKGEKYTLVEKVALILSEPDNDELKNELFKKLGDFVLLRNRCHEISELLKDPKKILAILKNHEKKVSWQLRRIYRTRNLVVHSNEVPPFLNILIENAHTYLDTFLSQVLSLATGNDRINSIHQAVTLTAMRAESYEAYLKVETKGCTWKNVSKILNKYNKKQSNS